ncbi:MAG: beta-N-acetylhexosaminidase [Pseudothermotoga sp.]
MDLKQMVSELFMIGVDGKQLNDQTIRVLEEVRPGFVILFARNIESATQVCDLIRQITRVVGKSVVFAIDQEGGIVTRLRDGFAVSCGAMALAATGDENNAYLAGKILSKEMKSIGITWNLAPVVDINDNPHNPGIGVRSFGDNPQKVITFSTAFYSGLKEMGVAACAKHFPGKGSVSVDAHLDMPTLDKSLEQLERWELLPFVELIKMGIESVMPSHIFLPQLQKNKVPATVSKEIVTGLLREKLSYDGIAVADDLLMGGITKNMCFEDAVIESFKAGMDVLTVCHEPAAQQSAVKALLKKIEDDPKFENRLKEALTRIRRFKERFSPKDLSSEPFLDFSQDQQVMEKIAEQSITLVSDQDQMIPVHLSKDDCIITVKTSRLVQVQENEPDVPWIAKELSKRFSVKLFVVEKDKPVDLSGNACIFFTENAHLYEWQRSAIEKARRNFKKLLVVALRNPYDCFLFESSSVCSYSYELISQKALLKVLLGEIKPIGRLPVEVRR